MRINALWTAGERTIAIPLIATRLKGDVLFRLHAMCVTSAEVVFVEIFTNSNLGPHKWIARSRGSKGFFCWRLHEKTMAIYRI